MAWLILWTMACSDWATCDRTQTPTGDLWLDAQTEQAELTARVDAPGKRAVVAVHVWVGEQQVPLDPPEQTDDEETPAAEEEQVEEETSAARTLAATGGDDEEEEQGDEEAADEDTETDEEATDEDALESQTHWTLGLPWAELEGLDELTLVVEDTCGVQGEITTPVQLGCDGALTLWTADELGTDGELAVSATVASGLVHEIWVQPGSTCDEPAGVLLSQQGHTWTGTLDPGLLGDATQVCATAVLAGCAEPRPQATAQGPVAEAL